MLQLYAILRYFAPLYFPFAPLYVTLRYSPDKNNNIVVVYSQRSIILFEFCLLSRQKIARRNRYILFIATYGTLLAYFRRLKSILLRIWNTTTIKFNMRLL